MTSMQGGIYNMTKFRWSIKELKEDSDDVILRGLVSERLSDLNHYAPLATRLKKIYHKLDARIETREKKIE